MDLKRTSRFLAMLRRNGVTRYRDGKLEVDIGPASPAFPTMAPGKPTELVSADEAADVEPEWTRRLSDIDLALHPLDYDPDESEVS